MERVKRVNASLHAGADAAFAIESDFLTRRKTRVTFSGPLTTTLEKALPSSCIVNVSRRVPKPFGKTVYISKLFSESLVSLTWHSPRMLLPGGTGFVTKDPSSGRQSSTVIHNFTLMVTFSEFVVNVIVVLAESAAFRSTQPTPKSSRIGEYDSLQVL